MDKVLLNKYIEESGKTQIDYVNCPKCNEEIILKTIEILSKQERVNDIIKEIDKMFKARSEIFNDYIYELVEEFNFVYFTSTNMSSKNKMHFPIIIYEIKEERCSQNGCELNIDLLIKIVQFFKDYYGNNR